MMIPKLIEHPKCCGQAMVYSKDAPEYFGWLYRCKKCKKETVVFNRDLFHVA
jgi:ribosomal protein S27E